MAPCRDGSRYVSGGVPRRPAEGTLHAVGEVGVQAPSDRAHRLRVVLRRGRRPALAAGLVDEVGGDRPGQQVMRDRLLDLLLLATLRTWFDRPAAHAPPWYRAMDVPAVGRALRLLHEDPAPPVDRGGPRRRNGPAPRRTRAPLHRTRRRTPDDLPRLLAHRPGGRPAARDRRHGRRDRPEGRLRQRLRPERRVQTPPRDAPHRTPHRGTAPAVVTTGAAPWDGLGAVQLW